jgi:hypothetical protein
LPLVLKFQSSDVKVVYNKLRGVVIYWHCQPYLPFG